MQGYDLDGVEPDLDARKKPSPDPTLKKTWIQILINI